MFRHGLKIQLTLSLISHHLLFLSLDHLVHFWYILLPCLYQYIFLLFLTQLFLFADFLELSISGNRCISSKRSNRPGHHFCSDEIELKTPLSSHSLDKSMSQLSRAYSGPAYRNQVTYIQLLKVEHLPFGFFR